MIFRYSIFLVGLLALGQTNLSGPIGAMPDNSFASTSVVSWNSAQKFKAGFVADSALEGDSIFTIKFAEIDFDRMIRTGAIHTINNDIDDIGTTTNRYRYLFATGMYNYATTGSTFLVSNTLPIIFDTLTVQPIYFYTNNTLRGYFDGNGVFNVQALVGTGYRSICTDASGNIVVSGSCPSAGTTNSHLVTTCATLLTLTGTYTSTGCTLTASATGYWLLTSTVDLIVSYATGVPASATFGLFVNGSLPSSSDVAALAIAGGTNGELLAATLTHSWVYNVNSGDTLDIRSATSGGTSNQSYVGNFTAVYLHP